MISVRSIAAWGLASVVALLGACGLNTDGGLASPSGSGGGSGQAGAAGMAGHAQGGGAGHGGISGSGGASGKGGATGTGGSQPDASDDVGVGGAAGAGGTPAQGGAPGSGGTPAEGGAAGTGGTPAEGGAAGVGGATGPETDCTNDSDDDGDGKSDCEDDDCTKAGYQTLPAVPSNATLFWFHERPLADSVPACPSQWQEGFFEFKAGSITCDCGCGDASGGECNVPAAKPLVSAHSNCGNPVNNDANWGTCRQVPNTWTLAGLKGAGGTVKTPAACSPSVAKTLVPPSFAKAVDLCSVTQTGKGAGAGQVCVASGPADYGAKACALFDGAVDCSTIAGYTHSHKYYSGQSDTRGCDVQGCTCDPANSTCQASVAFYSDTACQTLLKEYPTKDGACVAMNPVYDGGDSGSYHGRLELTPGTCTAKGAATVTGAATATGERTLCCP